VHKWRKKRIGLRVSQHQFILSTWEFAHKINLTSSVKPYQPLRAPCSHVDWYCPKLALMKTIGAENFESFFRPLPKIKPGDFTTKFWALLFKLSYFNTSVKLLRFQSVISIECSSIWCCRELTARTARSTRLHCSSSYGLIFGGGSLIKCFTGLHFIRRWIINQMFYRPTLYLEVDC